LAIANPIKFSYFRFKDGFYFGGRLNNGICNFKTDASSQLIQLQGGDFSSYGLACGYMLNHHLGIQTGVNMNNYHWVFMQNNIDNSFQRNTHQKSITVPITLRYLSSRPNKVGVFANAGMQWCVLSQTSMLTVAYTLIGPNYSTSDDNSFYKNTTTMLTASTGIHIPSGRFSIDIGAEYAKGSNISKESYYSLTPKFITGFLQVNCRL
jgi:hypothetical protein